MSALILFFLAVLSLLLTAFCSGSETAFLSIRRGRIIHMVREGGKRAKIIYRAITDIGRTMTTLLVGSNLATVTFSSSTAALFSVACPGMEGLQAFLSVAAAFVMLFLGEFLPKLLCAARPLRRMLILAPFWVWLDRILSPLTKVMQEVIRKALPKREPKSSITPETILHVLEDRKDGVKLTDFESALIGRIMVLRSRNEFVVPDSLLSALDEV